MPKFSANLIYLFNEFELINRIKAAGMAGFKGVECQRPFSIQAPTIKELLTEYEIEMVLINTPSSPSWPNDNGIAIFPERIQAFQELVETAIIYADAIDCRRVHVVAGHIPESLSWRQAEETYLSNLIWAAELGLKNDVKILIEPLNRIDNPNYFLSTTTQAIDLISRADCDNLYLQYDLYHAGMNGEDIVKNIPHYLKYIEHMQVAGVPGRREPDTGDINMMKIFTKIDEINYQGWIGAEYSPSTTTISSLNWGNRYGIG